MPQIREFYFYSVLFEDQSISSDIANMLLTSYPNSIFLIALDLTPADTSALINGMPTLSMELYELLHPRCLIYSQHSREYLDMWTGVFRQNFPHTTVPEILAEELLGRYFYYEEADKIIKKLGEV